MSEGKKEEKLLLNTFEQLSEWINNFSLPIDQLEKMAPNINKEIFNAESDEIDTLNTLYTNI